MTERRYIVHPDSPGKIAAKIRWIFEHWEAAESWGRTAGKRCVENYNTAKMAIILGDAIARLF